MNYEIFILRGALPPIRTPAYIVAGGQGEVAGTSHWQPATIFVPENSAGL
jgi:hypothetical protein